MSQAKTPELEDTGADEHGGLSTFQCITAREVEITFIRALFGINAQRVLSAIAGLDKTDIYAEQHRVILDALTRRAGQQVEAGDGHRPVDPVLVNLDLCQAGALAQDTVRSTLIAVITGNPVPPFAVTDLAAELRQARLRRACITAGESLIHAASNGGTDDLAGALAHLRWLPQLAERAGINMEGVNHER